MFSNFANFMSAQSRYQSRLVVLLRVLFFVFPLFIGTVGSWASGGYLLLVVFALISIRCVCEDPVVRRHDLQFPILLFFIALLLSFLNCEDWSWAVKWLGKLLALLFLVPTVMGLRRLSGGFMRPLGLGVLSAGFVVGGVALYAQVVLHSGRQIGYYNPIIFGDLAILIGVLVVCLSLSGIYQRWLLWLMPFSAVSALYAAVVSMTRGSWLAVPMIIFLLLFLLMKGGLFKDPRSRGRGFCGAVIILIFVLLSPGVFPGTIGTQIKRTYTGIVDFNPNEQKDTSIGIRLLLWDISIDIWKKKPFLGTGMGDFILEQELAMKQQRTALKDTFRHAHSIYFGFLSQTGLFGFVTMTTALLILPFRIFYRALFYVQTAEERFACLGGMALIVCYAVFGLTEAVFSRSAFVASFAFFLATFLSAISDRPRLEFENDGTDT